MVRSSLFEISDAVLNQFAGYFNFSRSSPVREDIRVDKIVNCFSYGSRVVGNLASQPSIFPLNVIM